MGIQLRVFISFLIVFSFIYLFECEDSLFDNIDSTYYLVNEAYRVAKNLFNQGRANYDNLKIQSLHTIDIFLDLVHIINEEMSRELGSAILKYYKIKYFYDFTNYVITLEEMIDIVEHCLIDPAEKVVQIRDQFHGIIKNFKDARNFDTIDKCHDELPDEVSSAHCILHQAVLFNETMQDDLVQIIEIKTRQHAQDMNSSLYSIQECIRDFVPKFFDQLLLDVYTDKCLNLRVLNASIADLMKDNWRSSETLFLKKWSPLVKLLKERSQASPHALKDPSS